MSAPDAVLSTPETAPGDPWRRWRGWWRVIGSVVAIAMLVAGVVNVVGKLSERTETVDRSLSTEGIGSLQVEVDSSELEIVGGSGDRIVVTGTIVTGLRRTELVVDGRDGVAVVQLDCHRGPLDACGGSLRIEVPQELDVSVDAPDTGVSLDGLDGDVEVRSTNSAIAASFLSGRVRLHTTNDSVVAGALRSSDVEVTTSNDRVELAFEVEPRSVVVETSNDAVLVVVPNTEEFYDLQLATSNASTSAEVRSDPDSDRRIAVETSNDDIVVTYPG